MAPSAHIRPPTAVDASHDRLQALLPETRDCGLQTACDGHLNIIFYVATPWQEVWGAPPPRTPGENLVEMVAGLGLSPATTTNAPKDARAALKQP